MGRTKIVWSEISVLLLLPVIAGAVEVAHFTRLTQVDLEFFMKQEPGHLRGWQMNVPKPNLVLLRHVTTAHFLE